MTSLDKHLRNLVASNTHREAMTVVINAALDPSLDKHDHTKHVLRALTHKFDEFRRNKPIEYINQGM